VVRTITQVVRHSILAALEATLIVILIFGLIASGALAAKGGGRQSTGGSYTVSVDQSAPYSFGETISISTTTPTYPDNTGPWIDLSCFQGDVKVLDTMHAAFDGGWYYGWPFSLGPTQMWSGGAADCTVRVYHQKQKRLVTDATTSFHVGP
jgi:hypothetical protein